MKKKVAGIVIGIILLILILCCWGYIKSHTFTLNGDEQVQPVTGNVKVTSFIDTEVIFIDVKTGDNYAIPYIAAGSSESINLEKGKWYSIENGEGLTVSIVNVRME